MVSKASDDLPEPDRPVKTTSLSRGISRSTFLRLCSRAPRIVIARMPEPVCWRFALITSSISVFPGAWTAPRSGAHLPDTGDRTPKGELGHRKNGHGFPVPLADHQLFVAARLAARAGESRGTGRDQMKSAKIGIAKQKGRRKAGLF